MPGLPAWALSVARVAGVAPYRRASPQDEYRRSRPLAVASILSLCTVASYVCWWSVIRDSFRDDGVDVVQQRALSVVTVLSMGTYAVLVAALCGRQFGCLRELLNSPGLRDAAPRRPLLAWLVAGSYLLGLAYGLGGYVARSGGSGGMLLWAVCILYLSFAKACNASLFAFLLSCVCRRLEDANARLRERAEGCGDTLSAQDIAALRRQYQDVRGDVARLCYCFGPQVLADLLQDLWWVVRQAFFVLTEVCSVLGAVNATIDTAKSIVAKGTLIYIAQQLLSEVEKTPTFVANLRNSSLPLHREEKNELEEFLRQLHQQPLVVRLCGSIDLSYSTLFQAAGIGISYATILLQFQGNAQT